MKYVSIFELRDNLASILNLVASGETTVIITRHDKPIAKIHTYVETREKNPFLSSYGMLKDDGISGEEYVNRIRRNARERSKVKKLRNRS